MKYCFSIALILMTFAFAEEEVALLEPTELALEQVDANFFDEKPATVEESELVDPNFELKSPGLAVGLSAIVPGLGNGYLGDYRTGGSIFGSMVGLFTTGSVAGNDTLAISTLVAAGNTWSYGIYAAYRDARAYNHDFGYTYPMPSESFKELSLASFQWSVISKPEVWGGVLGALGIGVGLSHLMSVDEKEKDSPSLSRNGKLFPLAAFPVGIGEETLFRGFLMPAFTEMWGPRMGLIASSVAFGLVHIPNGFAMPEKQRSRYYALGIPFITVSGAYMGWMVQKNNSLKESVAYHSWYDFVLFAASYSASSSIGNQKPTFAFSCSF